MAEEYVGRKFETVFVEGNASDTAAVKDIISASKSLCDLGLTPENAGNLSVRTEKGMLITVGGKNKGQLNEHDVVEVVSFDFITAGVVGKKEPSSEVPMHWLIYQSYPMANAVVHVHDDLVLEAAGKLKVSLGIHQTLEKASYGTQEQAFEVIEALRHSQYAIIKDHGIVCIGASLSEAVEKVIGVHSLVTKGI